MALSSQGTSVGGTAAVVGGCGGAWAHHSGAATESFADVGHEEGVTGQL